MEFCEIVEKTISLEMINILVSGTEHLGASFSHIYSEGSLLRISDPSLVFTLVNLL